MYGVFFENSKAQHRVNELNSKTLETSFWENPDTAKNILKEKNSLEKIITDYTEAKKQQQLLSEFMISLEKDYDDGIFKDIQKSLKDLKRNIKTLEVSCFLSDENDKRDCYLEVHAGAGGTESQDWAEMLRRMYVKWAEKKGHQIELVSESKGEEAGIKSSTIKISGYNVYGYLKNESGVHRLVRISPFDSNKRRHTSFSSVWIYPVVDDDIKIDINEKDLRIDTYRSSGAGGQHVNTTDSAVRITHLPTKIVVQCQNERSQHKNKESAMKMLKSRLYELELKKREESNKNIETLKTDIGWGHQIRSYVLQPYQLVKDNRTDCESTSPEDVLNGDIDEFLESALFKTN